MKNIKDSRAGIMNPDSAERIFQAKYNRRKELANLSFDEKIRILVKLQRIAKNIRKDPALFVWKIKGS